MHFILSPSNHILAYSHPRHKPYFPDFISYVRQPLYWLRMTLQNKNANWVVQMIFRLLIRNHFRCEKENLFLRNRKFVENGLFPYEIPWLFVKNAFTGGKNAFCWFCWLKITFRCLSKIQDSFRFFKLLVALFKIDPFFYAIFSVGKIIFKMPLIIFQFVNASAENDVQLFYSFQKNGRKMSCCTVNWREYEI